MERLKDALKGWWGVVMPPLVLFVSDLGLPDAPWWVPWAIAGTSLASYIVGRANASVGRVVSTRRVIVQRLNGLNDEQVKLLSAIYHMGAFVTAWDSHDALVLTGLAGMGLVVGSGGLEYTWFLTEECRDALDDEMRGKGK